MIDAGVSLADRLGDRVLASSIVVGPGRFLSPLEGTPGQADVDALISDIFFLPG